jgi:hypothetical protein
MLRIQALVAADIQQLQSLHSADYQLITPSGRTFSRDQYVGAIASAQLRYLRWEAGTMEVRTSEAMAIVRYRVTLQLGSPEDPGTTLQCWHTDSYEFKDGIWQTIWSQATEIKP